MRAPMLAPRTAARRAPAAGGGPVADSGPGAPPGRFIARCSCGADCGCLRASAHGLLRVVPVRGGSGPDGGACVDRSLLRAASDALVQGLISVAQAASCPLVSSVSLCLDRFCRSTFFSSSCSHRALAIHPCFIPFHSIHFLVPESL